MITGANGDVNHKSMYKNKNNSKNENVSFKTTKINIDEQTFECYYNNNRYDLCGQNYLSVWNFSKQDFIMVHYPADSSALVLSEWSTGTHQRFPFPYLFWL